MNLFNATIQLTKASFGVLRRNPRLAVFPLLTLAAVVLILLTLLPLLAGSDAPPWLWLIGAVLAMRFADVFFEAALCGEALRCLHGESPSVRSGLRSAAKRIGPLALYTIITSTVGFALALLGRSSRAGVNLARRLATTAWSLITYFALPVIVQEKRGGYDSMVRSGQLFKSVWGETTLAEVGIRAFAAHLSLLLILILVWLVMVLGDSLPVLLIVIGAWVAMIALVGALEGVYRSAMYIFAAEGVVPEPFDTKELDAIWRAK